MAQANPKLIHEREGRSTEGIVAVQKQADLATELAAGLDADVRKHLRLEYVGFDPDANGVSRFSMRGIVPRDAPEALVRRVEKAIADIGAECDKEAPINDSDLPTVKLYGDSIS
ncbi:MAG TPA: hypothetical protein VL944_00140 [Candidatus Acidoferrum sp.]|nr:hypothetical protein [Candidatus Acidoferrum sp.]